MPEGDLEVHHLNVGEGHASLVVGPEGETTLVDTGPGNVAGPDVDVNEHVSEHIEELGRLRDDVDGLDNMVITHFDTDHSEGAVELARRHDVDDVYTPNPDSYDPAAGTKPDDDITRKDKPSDQAQETIQAFSELHTEGQLTLHSDIDTDEDLDDLFASEDIETNVLTPGSVEPPELPYGDGESGIADEAEGTSWNEGSLSFEITHDAGGGSPDRIGIMGDNETIPDRPHDYDHLLAAHHGSNNNVNVVRSGNPDHATVSSAHENRNGNRTQLPGERYRDAAPAGASNTYTAYNGTVSVISDGTTRDVDVYTQYGGLLEPDDMTDGDETEEALPDVEAGFGDGYREEYEMTAGGAPNEGAGTGSREPRDGAPGGDSGDEDRSTGEDVQDDPGEDDPDAAPALAASDGPDPGGDSAPAVTDTSQSSSDADEPAYDSESPAGRIDPSGTDEPPDEEAERRGRTQRRADAPREEELTEAEKVDAVNRKLEATPGEDLDEERVRDIVSAADEADETLSREDYEQIGREVGNHHYDLDAEDAEAIRDRAEELAGPEESRGEAETQGRDRGHEPTPREDERPWL